MGVPHVHSQCISGTTGYFPVPLSKPQLGHFSHVVPTGTTATHSCLQLRHIASPETCGECSFDVGTLVTFFCDDSIASTPSASQISLYASWSQSMCPLSIMLSSLGLRPVIWFSSQNVMSASLRDLMRCWRCCSDIFTWNTPCFIGAAPTPVGPRHVLHLPAAFMVSRPRPIVPRSGRGMGLRYNLHARQSLFQPLFDVGHDLVSPGFAVGDEEARFSVFIQTKQELTFGLFDLLECAIWT